MIRRRERIRRGEREEGVEKKDVEDQMPVNTVSTVYKKKD
jgi:hypothetical protein